MKEEWKEIEYEYGYEVSNLGRVRNQKSSRILKPYIYQGHVYVRLYQEDRKIAYGRAVRMLVADAFIPNPENAKRVKHKDGDKLNVCVDNLYWNVRPPKLQHKGKPTVRYDLNGNQEKVYDRLVDVEKDGYRRTMVSHAISQCVPYKKKLWSH